MKLLNRQDERRIANAVIADPEQHTVMDRSGAVRSIQAANVDMPEDELLALWKPVNLERLARTYWKYLSRVTLGMIRVTYTENERAVVVIGRPLVLLRFHAPEYEISDGRGIVRWRIQDGLLVSRAQRGLPRDRRQAAWSPTARATARVHVEVEVANFYPAIATWIARWVYVQTQSRIHVLVTHGFLRSLARLELEESAVGRFAEGDASGPSTSATPPGRASPCSPARRSARVIPATSTSAACEEGLAPMELMKPWKSPGKRRASTGTPAARSASA